MSEFRAFPFFIIPLSSQGHLNVSLWISPIQGLDLFESFEFSCDSFHVLYDLHSSEEDRAVAVCAKDFLSEGLLALLALSPEHVVLRLLVVHIEHSILVEFLEFVSALFASVVLYLCSCGLAECDVSAEASLLYDCKGHESSFRV